MNSLDGIIAPPKGLKREARRLITLVFMLAPIGVIGSLALSQNGQGGAASRTITSPASPVAPAPVASPLLSQTNESPASSQAGASIQVQTNQVTPSQPPVTKVQVNQQSITVPPDGNVHRVISSDGSTTTLDVTNSTNSTSDTSSSTSTNIQVNSFSNTSTSSQTDTGP